MTINILILYYSANGATAMLAKSIARGVNSIEGANAVLRTVPRVQHTTEQTEPAIPSQGAPYCTAEDLSLCAGLILGSPTRFGNMAAPLKYFWDNTATQWLNGSLINKPAGVFTSSSSMHGGQESTLLSMMLPLLHHGMVITGIPYSEESIHQTHSGGGPYGASHIQHKGSAANTPLSLTKDETSSSQALGKRIASLAIKLNA